ncbi:Tm-1-like ATP-binding domain-containing protein [Pseudomonas brenneri]|uniref:Tm-1-like ATP-binding domain-containing protein n=1 Tax=Pseudomonas brenneri TaxID=129817 RepID=UPI0035712F9F
MNKKKPSVLLIATLDTKSEEASFIREQLEAAGLKVYHMDASIRQVMTGHAEISPDEIAGKAGSTLQEVRDLKHEGKCLEKMTEGAVICAMQLHKRIGLSGVIAIGGSMGTSLGTAVMRELPFGLPKVMVSTMASGMTRGFVGTKDIAMFHSVADISGINVITRSVFHNAAMALAGQAFANWGEPSSDKPLVVVSTLGTTEKCSLRVRKMLEGHGFEVVVFHTTGTGGATMDEIIRDRDVSVVVDMSLSEINDLLNGGLCSAGPDRCKAAIIKGVPTIFAPGNADFIIAGPHEQAVLQFPGKRYHVHNPALTAVRTEAHDLKHLAEHMAKVASMGSAPVAFFVPMQGFSAHDSADGFLHDLTLPPIFSGYLKEVMPERVVVREVDSHINDEPFADALVQQVLEFHSPVGLVRKSAC